MLRDIDVLPLDDRKFAEYRIPVMTERVNAVLPVRDVGPQLVGEEGELAGIRPIKDALGMTAMLAEHLLEKHDVGVHSTHGLTDLVQNKTPVSGAEPFVDVIRKKRQTLVVFFHYNHHRNQSKRVPKFRCQRLPLSSVTLTACSQSTVKIFASSRCDASENSTTSHSRSWKRLR